MNRDKDEDNTLTDAWGRPVRISKDGIIGRWYVVYDPYITSFDTEQEARKSVGLPPPKPTGLPASVVEKQAAAKVEPHKPPAPLSHDEAVNLLHEASETPEPNPNVKSLKPLPAHEEAITLLYEASEIFRRGKPLIEGYDWIKRVRQFLGDS